MKTTCFVLKHSIQSRYRYIHAEYDAVIMFLIVLEISVYCRPAAHRHEPDQTLTAQILVDSMTNKIFPALVTILPAFKKHICKW